MPINWSELSVFVGAISASIATIIYATQKSRCRHIDCGCISCDREIPDEEPPPPVPATPPNSPTLGYTAP